uniref:ADAMTS-like protein 5 n=1 Tax=Phallusia mammillata TaxID=59560 RepID=A0A6F9D5A6_9ASCI|nr:ADAMTS-like protein 5 [Phallusia mammillata]
MIVNMWAKFFLVVLCVSISEAQDFDQTASDVYHPAMHRVGTRRRSEEVSKQNRDDVYQPVQVQPNAYFEAINEFAELEPDEFSQQDWSMWTEWSFCSRSCGGGVAMRTRRCGIRTLEDAIRDCSGDDVEHQICNSMDCEGISSDFRATQCSHYDTVDRYDTKQLRWHPHYVDAEPCNLYCMARGFYFYKSFGLVMDGTRCRRENNGICISGECVRVGCNNVLGSNLTNDACGVCGGDNSTCTFFKGVAEMNSNAAKFDYNVAKLIPAGATHIRVRESSKNYLALVEAEGPYLNYVLNDKYLISWSVDLTAAGTEFRYERAKDDIEETLVAEGPTTTDLYIMVLYLSGEPNVEYEYWLPKNRGTYAQLVAITHTIPAVEARESPSDEQDYEFMSPYSPPSTKASTTTSVTTTTAAPTTTTTTTEATTTTARTRNVPQVKPTNKKRKKPSYCTPCKKPSSRKRHFCQSDFVIHARVQSKKKVEGKRFSHDVLIKTVYKSDFKLMKREYIWVYSSCCPKLRPYRDYLIMGRKRRIERTPDSNGIVQFVGNATAGENYETRLVVDHMDYWHFWKRKYADGMRKVSNSNICDNFKFPTRSNILRDPEQRRAPRKPRRRRTGS